MSDLEEEAESWRSELCHPRPPRPAREFLEALPERAPAVHHPTEIVETPVLLELPESAGRLTVLTFVETPVLFVTRVYVWCWYCKTEHVHGRGLGHRTAHCAPGSPLARTGYLIRHPSASAAPG